VSAAAVATTSSDADRHVLELHLPGSIRVDELEVADDVPPGQRDEHPAGVQVPVQLGGGVLGQLEQAPQVAAGTGVELDPGFRFRARECSMVALLHSYRCKATMLHQDGAGVEQVEPSALRVLLGLRAGLGHHDGDVAAGRRGVDESRRQQRGLDAVATVRGCGRRPGELRDALGEPQAGGAGEDAVAQRGIPHDAGGGHVALGPDVDLAGELLVPGHALGVGVGDAVGGDVEPGVELLVAAAADLDPGWRDALVLVTQRPP
jgi:hypothetical protein